MPRRPPGLSDEDLAELLRTLPNRRGLLRLAGYYLVGPATIVVFDVLDEGGTPLPGAHGPVRVIRAEYPAELELEPAGTLYRVG